MIAACGHTLLDCFTKCYFALLGLLPWIQHLLMTLGSHCSSCFVLQAVRGFEVEPNNIRAQMFIHPCVCASIRPQKVYHFSEIWCMCGEQWVMNGGVPYDPIQGQRQGHQSLKFRIYFQNLSPPPFTFEAGKWPLILKLQCSIYICSGWIFYILS